jgi:hypothetical protein
MSQEFNFPHALDLEIFDRKQERELTLQWRDLSLILHASPALKALKLDCNINYECLKTPPRSGAVDSDEDDSSSDSSESSSDSDNHTQDAVPFDLRPCQHPACKAKYGHVFLRDLRDLRLNRYDMEEVSALLLQLHVPSLKALTLSAMDVYPTITVAASGTGSRLEYPRFSPTVLERILSHLETLTLMDFDFDGNNRQQRIIFAQSFFDAFQNITTLEIHNCPDDDILPALTPHPSRVVRGRMFVAVPHLNRLRMTSGSTRHLPNLVVNRRRAKSVLECLVLVNTVVDNDPEDLIALGLNLRYFDYVAVERDRDGQMAMRMWPEIPSVPDDRRRSIEEAKRAA